MLEDTLLSETVVAALRMAAVNRGDRRVESADLLCALVDADGVSRWDYVFLETGDISDLQRRGVVGDAGADALERWDGVPLSAEAATALGHAEHVARERHLLPLPPGVLALALLRSPSSGASRLLLAGGQVDHVQVVDLVQEHVLGRALPPEDIAPVVAGQRVASDPVSATSHGQVLEVERRAVRLAAPRPAGELEVLLAACQRAPDHLEDVLTLLWLDDEDLLRPALDEVDRADGTASDAVQRARRLYDAEDPTAAQLIAAAALGPCERVRQLLWLVGTTGEEVAAGVVRTDEEHEGTWGAPPRAAVGWGVLVFLAGIAASALVVAAALEVGPLWLLALLLPVWWGHPQSAAGVSLAVALVLLVLVGPLAGAAMAIGALLEVPWAMSERRTVWSRTGARLTLRQHRRHLWRQRPGTRTSVMVWQGRRAQRRLARS